MIWVALSYVWGHAKSSPNLKSTELGLPLGELPVTVKDAIKVTKLLKYQYLWIDRYCIDQEDEASRQNQLNKMDAIYRGADLTIIAAAGKTMIMDYQVLGLPHEESSKLSS